MYKRFAAIFSVASVVLILAYLLVVAQQIRHESYIHEEQPADLIIVLGAAEYRGKPSPVLQARLNHALMLYLKQVAPYILTTGGAGAEILFHRRKSRPRLFDTTRSTIRGDFGANPRAPRLRRVWRARWKS